MTTTTRTRPQTLAETTAEFLRDTAAPQYRLSHANGQRPPRYLTAEEVWEEMPYWGECELAAYILVDPATYRRRALMLTHDGDVRFALQPARNPNPNNRKLIR